MQQFIRAQWQKRGLWAWLMSPLGQLVCGLSSLKRQAYLRGWRPQTQLTIPIIVVGNITVGGAGKTPLVAHITQLLLDHGFKPGIISRGYKGQAKTWPQAVTASSDPSQVGDEPVMLARLTGQAVAAGAKRAESAQHLIDHFDCNVIISDDGFQHLKLARDIDIVVTDATHGFGNRWCLPAGPLREPLTSLSQADFQIMHGSSLNSNRPDDEHYLMTLLPGEIYKLGNHHQPAADNLKLVPLHAIAGIGDPSRFFSSLRAQGFEIIEHAFSDHHHYQQDDLAFDDQYALITTEKDAIKLATMKISKTIWVLPVKADLDPGFDIALLDKLRNLSDA